MPLVKNNVNLCLFDSNPNDLDIKNAKSYIALGELKGGIDPAGADEHWKTARTALERIRKSFLKAQLSPRTFFVGAAIEKKMADEIWNELQNNELSNAANLNEDNRVASLSHWLCNLQSRLELTTKQPAGVSPVFFDLLFPSSSFTVSVV